MCTTVRHSKTAVAEGERPLSHFLIQVHIHTKRMEARINYNAGYGIWSYTLLLNGNYCCIKRRSVDLLFSQGIRFGTKEVHKSSASTTKQCKYLARYDSLCVSRYLRSAQPLVNCKWSGLLDFSLTYITPISVAFVSSDTNSDEEVALIIFRSSLALCPEYQEDRKAYYRSRVATGKTCLGFSASSTIK